MSCIGKMVIKEVGRLPHHFENQRQTAFGCTDLAQQYNGRAETAVEMVFVVVVGNAVTGLFEDVQDYLL